MIVAVNRDDTAVLTTLTVRQLAPSITVVAAVRESENADLLTRRVEVGMLWINMPAMPSAEMPFGGIKDSGYGSEGGPESLEAYLNVRSVAVMNV